LLYLFYLLSKMTRTSGPAVVSQKIASSIQQAQVSKTAAAQPKQQAPPTKEVFIGVQNGGWKISAPATVRYYVEE
jgi:hypothetical protein